MITHKCPTCGGLTLFPLARPEYDIAALLDEWISGLELEGRSYAHLQKLRQISRSYILPCFRGQDIRSIKAFHVQSYYHGLLRKKLSTKTVKHALDTLHNFLNAQHGLERTESVPRFPKVLVKATREKAWISPEAQARILSFVPLCHQLPFLVLFETGMRPSEVRALKRKDVRDGGVFVCRAFDERGYVKETKTRAEYFFPLSDGLVSRLCEHARLFFPDAFLWGYSRTRFGNLWRAACKACGVKIELYQAARHSKASKRRAELEAGMKEELRKVLGHTTASTTLKHYALTADREVSAVAGAVAENKA